MVLLNPEGFLADLIASDNGDAVFVLFFRQEDRRVVVSSREYDRQTVAQFSSARRQFLYSGYEVGRLIDQRDALSRHAEAAIHHVRKWRNLFENLNQLF